MGAALVASAAVIEAQAAFAIDSVSTSYRLRSTITVSGGATSVSSPQSTRAGVTLGQPAPGKSIGEDTGVVLHGGFWPASVGAAADPDRDGVASVVDNCPFAANPDQADSGGVGAGSTPDAVGDACQCGDVSGDGRVTIADAVLISRALLVPPTVDLPHPDRCDVGGSAACTNADAILLRRALLVPATATIRERCAAATASGS